MVRLRTLSGALIIMLLLSLPLAGTVGAADAGTVVASGLSSPRFLAIADDGTIYVSEAGSGGAEQLPAMPGGPGGDMTRGKTGQVSKIAPGGAKSLVAGNLPSYGSGEGSTGPAGIVYAGGSLWLANGNFVPQGTPLSYEGQVIKINPQGGSITKVADLGAYEIAKNPDGTAVDSDLYGMAMGPDGNLYVADAAGNVLYQLNPNSGQFKVFATFAGLPAPQANPDRGGKNEFDPVPTGVAIAQDGTIYVGLLGGDGPRPGATKVQKVSPAGVVSDAATGFTYVVGVAVGPDGLLYVSELTQGADTTQQPPGFKPGRVTRVLKDGTKQIVADNLIAPNGIAFDKAGNLYVAVNTVDPKNGQVMRFAGVASAATSTGTTTTTTTTTTGPTTPLAPSSPAPSSPVPPSVTAPSTTTTTTQPPAPPSNYYIRRLGFS